MSSPAGAALLTKIALTLSNPSDGQVIRFLTLAEGWNMHEVAFDLPTTVTGLSDRDSAILRGSFARRVNSIPLPGDVWSTSGRYLWHIYGDVIDGGVILAQAPVSDADEPRVQAARSLIGPPDTPQYQAYVTYRDQCRALGHSLRQAELTLANATDSAVQAQAKLDRDEYHELLDIATQEWMVRGYKAAIEDAMQTLTQAFSKDVLRRWRFWQTEFSLVTPQDDSSGQFWPTTYRPNRLYDMGVGWTTFTLSGSEVATLAADIPPEVQRTQDALGNAVRADGEIQQLSMEIARIDVERPWFHPELLTSRFWKPGIPDDLPLSDGGQPLPHGTLPGYIIGLVLVRNISLTWKTAGGSTSDASAFRVFGNFALQSEVLTQVSRSQVVRPIPGEVFRRAVPAAANSMLDPVGLAAPTTPMLRPETLQMLATSPAPSTTVSDNIASRTAPRVAVPIFNGRISPIDEIVREGRIVDPLPLPTPASDTSGSHSTGDAVYLVAYIVQRTPKAPDPDPALVWP